MAHGSAEDDYLRTAGFRKNLWRCTSRWRERICIGIAMAILLFADRASKWLPAPDDLKDLGENVWFLVVLGVAFFFVVLGWVNMSYRYTIRHLLHSLERLERRVAELSDEIGSQRPKVT